jgi:hypothetical protein
MITARVDTSTHDTFIRDRVRVIAAYNDPYTILGRTADGQDYQFIPRVEQQSVPDGVTPYVLDAKTEVARAVYLALKEHFEPADPVPTITDRAYSDARADILRSHALINKMVDALTAPPTQVFTELVSDPGRTP